MRPKDLLKLALIFSGILVFGGLLVLSMTSALLDFLADQGVEQTFEVNVISTVFVILILSFVTYCLRPKTHADNDKPKRANKKYK